MEHEKDRISRAIERIRVDPPNVRDLIDAWQEVCSLVAFPYDDPESDNLDSLVRKGIANDIVQELSRALYGAIIESALTASTTICLSARNASVLVTQSNLVEALTHFVRSRPTNRLPAYALTSLTNLALHPVCHEELLRHGALEMALDYLKFLHSTNQDEIDFGLTSASLLCRLVGREESGPGPEAIRSNGELLKKLQWLLREVLNAGPNGIVLGYM